MFLLIASSINSRSSLFLIPPPFASRGTKYAYITGGASIYALFLVAGMEIKNKVKKENVLVIWQMGKMLKDPSCVDSGKFIVYFIF